ncbi:uncharacterized protein VDAG_02375 [Verticillium dahliae VdLs.17]|uniref:ATP-dependent DNA helicase n=1 Tax=Verticillium dahliae (strain VdLs.17 / ATCC MYA-4575 / FGSC 10137) TaxID=498257 RepID=G2WXP3_VERDV|nr:uncharacterized protein VDAG_02375 [Verticillium dahliae VdLs.17]EGY20851.1 hypothetical protein VDAG_02375 [Verticillium dahliae VdLs.17]
MVRRERDEEEETQDLASVLEALDKEFTEKERLSYGREWCVPVPVDRKVKTVQAFYKAFHETRTLPILICMFCYRKYSRAELEDVEWGCWAAANVAEKRKGSSFECGWCFPVGESIRGCADCVRRLRRGALSSAAQLHGRLGCEHMFPDELKGLTLVEEKLIALNACYGFITKYSVVEGHRQSTRYPRHIKGHITVFPNNVEELATRVLPHPLLRVMDDIHVSWHGSTKPAPSDLSALLSVRRRVVEKALLWLKTHNPLYADISIDTAELDSWDTPSHGVLSQVYERLERNEPSVGEKTRTAQVVPPTERGLEREENVDIREVLEMLNGGRDTEVRGTDGVEGDGERDANGVAAAPVHELRYVCGALRPYDNGGENRSGRWAGSVEVQSRGGSASEPYILVSRGEEFADPFDARYFAKVFPTLFPVGSGGPRQAEESAADADLGADEGVDAEATARALVSSRNMTLETWARVVLQRHGGRFATHHVFSFLVFNMGVRSRNRRVSLLSVTRKNFPEVERIVRSLSVERLEAAKVELEATGKTGDEAVYQLLKCLSLYGFRQPMSRESRLSSRRKMKSLLIREGTPAIWITLNPNDITNPVKLRLAAYRTRDPDEAESFLSSLDLAYKRTRLAISDPLSSAIFFHREVSMFFEHYVKTGDESVFGRVSRYFGAVETNERGALHMHGLLWLQGNMHLGSVLGDVTGEDATEYRERVVQYVDSVFDEDLDQEAFAAVQAERSVTSDISSLLQNSQQFSAAFDEEANFCAGATQIHTHSPTCVKYSIRGQGKRRDPCRFKAPWKVVERTAFTDGGVLQIRRSHSMVNRWNRAMAVGLRHNHDISFIATQCKTMAIVFYVTNYATKVEDPVWKRVAAAAELFPTLDESMGEEQANSADQGQNRTRRFLMRVANRIFTDRALSQVEVVAHLLGYPTEFASNQGWAFLNASSLYWQIFRRWDHLRRESGLEAADEAVEETALRRPGEHAVVCFDGYLSGDFSEESETYYKRAAVQHLAVFVPWQSFLCETAGDINALWERQRQCLSRRMAFFADNIQLLRRSAEDAKRDAKQWAAQSGDGDPSSEATGAGLVDTDERAASEFRSDGVVIATRLIVVLRATMGAEQITVGSREIFTMVQQLSRFEQSVLRPMDELTAAVANVADEAFAAADVPAQAQIRSIKSQQKCVSREKEKMIQGIQNRPDNATSGHGSAVGSVQEASSVQGSRASVSVRFGPSTSFSEAGRRLVSLFTLNRRQSIALRLICRQLDRIRDDENGTPQLCQFVGGEGGTGKSRVIDAIAELFASKGISHRLLVTATSGTAAAKINGITIHSACGFSKDANARGALRSDVDGFAPAARAGLRIDGQATAEWREKWALIIDEVSMLGARTLHDVDERLRQFRGSRRDFGGIPIVLFSGDFHQFRPVQERSILLPSTVITWDEERSFTAEQRYQHDRAHALSNRFTTVVMLNEQVRAAGDPKLQRLLTRVREGVQDQSDLDLLNSSCYLEDRRIPWESGITVVTPLNRNRWNLNVEAALCFQKQRKEHLRIFISEHRWKGGKPTEEEAVMMLGHGDDSSIPVPAVFLFVPGMPIVVNQNTHMGLKLVNGANYAAVDVILDRAHPGYRVDATTTLHFGPPAGIVLASGTTNDLHFVGMPAGTILLTPISTKIECQRKRPWQKNDVSRRGLPCAAAFACTDYKVQSKTLDQVALELRGTRTMRVDSRAVPTQCDPYSLYVQLSRCKSLDGIILLSKV